MLGDPNTTFVVNLCDVHKIILVDVQNMTIVPEKNLERKGFIPLERKGLIPVQFVNVDLSEEREKQKKM